MYGRSTRYAKSRQKKKTLKGETTYGWSLKKTELGQFNYLCILRNKFKKFNF